MTKKKELNGETISKLNGGKKLSVVKGENGFCCPYCSSVLTYTRVRKNANCGKGEYYLYGCGKCNKTFRYFYQSDYWTDD